MQRILNLSMTSSIKVMFIGFHRLPALFPFDVLNQLPEAALDLSFSLSGLVDLPDCHGNVPVPTLVDIHLNLYGLAGRMPEVFAKSFRTKRSPAKTQEERNLVS